MLGGLEWFGSKLGGGSNGRRARGDGRGGGEVWGWRGTPRVRYSLMHVMLVHSMREMDGDDDGMGI